MNLLFFICDTIVYSQNMCLSLTISCFSQTLKKDLQKLTLDVGIFLSRAAQVSRHYHNIIINEKNKFNKTCRFDEGIKDSDYCFWKNWYVNECVRKVHTAFRWARTLNTALERRLVYFPLGSVEACLYSRGAFSPCGWKEIPKRILQQE